MWIKQFPKLKIIIIFIVIFFSSWLYLLFRLSQQPQKYAQYWSRPIGQSGQLVFVAMGDSAAQGIGASSPQKSYVSLLAQSIKKKTGKEVQIINISQSGATIDDVIKNQLPVLDKLNPDVITLDIGGNDLREYDKKEFTISITKLTSQLPKQTIIADTPYFMHGIWERQAVEASRVLIQQAKFNGLTIAPLHMSMKNKGWPSMFYLYAHDWFHPNDKGYEVWHDAFWKVIEPEL